MPAPAGADVVAPFGRFRPGVNTAWSGYDGVPLDRLEVSVVRRVWTVCQRGDARLGA